MHDSQFSDNFVGWSSPPTVYVLNVISICDSHMEILHIRFFLIINHSNWMPYEIGRTSSLINNHRKTSKWAVTLFYQCWIIIVWFHDQFGHSIRDIAHPIRTLLLFFLLFHHYTVSKNKVWIVGYRPLWSIVFINTFSFQDFFLHWIVSIVSCILDFSWILNAFEFTLFQGISQTTFEDTLKFFDSFLIFFCFKLIKLFFFFEPFLISFRL